MSRCDAARPLQPNLYHRFTPLGCDIAHAAAYQDPILIGSQCCHSISAACGDMHIAAPLPPVRCSPCKISIRGGSGRSPAQHRSTAAGIALSPQVVCSARRVVAQSEWTCCDVTLAFGMHIWYGHARSAGMGACRGGIGGATLAVPGQRSVIFLPAPRHSPI